MKQRGGAVDHGRVYEQKIAALFSIRCALDPDISDFQIVSNIDDFEAFDDIVLLLESKDGSKTVYCVQLKHFEQKSSFQAIQLESDRGNFCLDKYYKSYEHIKKNIRKIPILNGISIDQIQFILYTNAKLSTKKAVSIKLENTSSFEILTTTAKTDNIFRVLNAENSQKPVEESFLERFSLYTNQEAATALDRLIKQEFDTHFDDVSNTVVTTTTDYFLKWAVSKKSKFKTLSKKDVHIKLLENILQPHIIEPKYSVEIKDSTLKLINDTLTDFNVTPILRKDSLENIFAAIDYTLQETCDIKLNFEQSWNTNLTEDQHDALKSNDKEQNRAIHSILKQKNQFVAQLTVKDLYLSAWQCKTIPLVINCDTNKNTIHEILFKFKTLTKNLSFVLLYSSDPSNLKGDLKVFNNFNSIIDPDLINRNLQNTFVSLQGKGALSLQQFKNSIEVLQEVTPDIYMILLNGVLQVGETYEVENYYIKRYLQRPLLSWNVLDESNIIKETHPPTHNDIFLLLEAESNTDNLYQYRPNMIDLATYTQDYFNEQINTTKYIIPVNLSSTDKEVKEMATFLHKETKKSVHVMIMQEYCLEWLFSKGSIDVLYNYMEDMELSEGNYIHEDNMVEHFQSDINIISNNAGMGKTFMLRSLANKFDPNKWVCLLNLTEHMSKINNLNQKQARDYIQYVMAYQMSMIDTVVQKLCVQIFRDCWISSNVIWLLDGYDEVSSEEALHFLKQVRRMSNIKVWITTRPTNTQDLEVLMDALSLQMTHFSEKDHVTFLWKYFESSYHIYGYDKEQIEYIINTINKCPIVNDKTFIAIPLQTRMLADIFGDDINQITEIEKLTVVDLYNKFIDIKLREYNSYEVTSLKKTLSKLALKLFYTEDQLVDLLDFEELAEEAVTFQESYKKNSIVIGLNKKGDAVFGHRTFAEFLAAYWLTKQIVVRKAKWTPLIEKLYYVDMVSVRLFFDKILCQNLPLHLAVLNNDIDNVYLLLSIGMGKSELDALGRSALHLAVSYGEHCALYISSDIKGLRAVGVHTAIKVSDKACVMEVPKIKTQLKISTAIVETLLEHGFVNTKDVLFDYDTFDYAVRSGSLDALNCLYKCLDKESLLFETDYSFLIFLYCVVYHNLYYILSTRKVYEFDTTPPLQHKLRNMFSGYFSRLLSIKYNNSYLTEIAALNGAKESLYELLQTGRLTVQDGFPVHKACFNGHSDVVQLLYEMGADVTKKDTDGWSPIYQAGRKRRTDVTYEFLKNSRLRRIMQKNVTSMTPMHYASQGGHLGCIQKLMELGASFLVRDAFANTPLYYAAIYGHIDIIEVMLNTLSTEQKRDKNIQSILNTVASKGYSVEKVVKCGLNVNNVDYYGNTPLILASKNGFPKVIEELAKLNCDLNLMKTNESLTAVQRWAQLSHTELSVKIIPLWVGLDSKAPGGLAAIHFAVLEGHADCVKTLILLGADKYVEDTIGLSYSPLIWAGIRGNQKVIETLLNTKTDSNFAQRELEDAEVALIMASIYGSEACVGTLLNYIESSEDFERTRNEEKIDRILRCEYGLYYPNLARPFGEVKNIPLVVAAINNRVGVIKVIAAKKYKCHQNDLNIALFWAAKNGHVEAVKTLIELGANENVKNERNMRVLPIVWASMNGRTEVVKFLLSIQPEDYSKNKDVAIALNFASTGGHIDCIKLLLDSGFDIENVYQDLSGGTPFLNACEYHSSDEAIKELLSRKCNIHVKNRDGLTSLHFLAKKKKFDLVKRLLKMGADEDNEVDVNSDTYKYLQDALDWAIAEEDNYLIYKLIELGISQKDSEASPQH